MRLDDFLRLTGASAAALAEAIGASESAISKWRSGERVPNVNHAVAIERATLGAVTCSDWARAPEAVEDDAA